MDAFELDRAAGGAQLGEHAAAADSLELVRVADEHEPPRLLPRELHQPVQIVRAEHAGAEGATRLLVELADGRPLLAFRQNRGPNRWMATSTDGGATWSEVRPGVKVSPVCCAIERFTLQAAGDERNRILWTGPKGPGRNKLIILTSYDECRTFQNERTISEEPAAYSDLTILKDKSVGVLWERGNYKFITFTRLDLSFLEPKK